MKNLSMKILLLVMISLFFVACDNEEESFDEILIGKWENSTNEFYRGIRYEFETEFSGRIVYYKVDKESLDQIPDDTINLVKIWISDNHLRMKTSLGEQINNFIRSLTQDTIIFSDNARNDNIFRVN